MHGSKPQEMAYRLVQKRETTQSDPLMTIFFGQIRPAPTDANPDTIADLERQFPTRIHRAVSSKLRDKKNQ